MCPAYRLQRFVIIADLGSMIMGQELAEIRVAGAKSLLTYRHRDGGAGAFAVLI
jgi:hypothetical protein